MWQLEAAPVAPFYLAIAELAEAFDARTFVALSEEIPAHRLAGVSVIRAGPGTRFAHPAELLREIYRLCRPGERRLLLFDSLDSMVEAWGTSSARGFFARFARCCWTLGRSLTGR